MSKANKLASRQDAVPSFEDLVHSIRGVDAELAAQARRAINVSLTLRNWLIGCYLAEYEQRGADRARNGAKLLEDLSARLKGNGVSRSEERGQRRYRQFYQTYPQIRESLPPEMTKHLGPEAVSPSGRVILVTLYK
jgi:hypothetical protein